MNKIICDVCGTSYQESAECCPICGCTRDEAIMLGEEFSLEEQDFRSGSAGGQASPKKKKAIFDFDEVNAEPKPVNRTEEVHYDEEDPVTPPPRHNTFAVIVLTILIAVLLLLSGVLFLRYLMPKPAAQEPEVTTLPLSQETTQEPQSTAIPCESLALTSGSAQLTTEGAFFLINVSVYPENTTDALIYHSADTSVATVDETGRITAVAEGSTVVYITCGTQQIPCEVICDFTPETVPPTVDTEIPEETGLSETVPETAEETTAETVAETVPETVPETAPQVVLKLKQKDFILDKAGRWTTMRLDCDLAPEDVEWSMEHSWIASVNEKGVVTALSKGVTKVIAKYGDQEVSCIVRCKW